MVAPGADVTSAVWISFDTYSFHCCYYFNVLSRHKKVVPNWKSSTYRMKFMKRHASRQRLAPPFYGFNLKLILIAYNLPPWAAIENGHYIAKIYIRNLWHKPSENRSPPSKLLYQMFLISSGVALSSWWMQLHELQYIAVLTKRIVH